MKKTLSLVAVLILAASAYSQTIAGWTFETTVPGGFSAGGAAFGSLTPETGSGSAFGFHSGDSVYSNPVGNGSGESWSSTNWNVGDYYEFRVSTLGFSGITVSYDQISSSTGPGRFVLNYSLDGTTFLPAAADYAVLVNSAPNAWSSSVYGAASHYSFDLSSITALDNAPTVYFRVTDFNAVAANGGAVAVTGTDRIDNFTVGLVPEPTSMTLLGLGLVGLALRRRS